MVPTRTKVPALRLVGLAIVLVLSGLAPTFHAAQAQSGTLTVLSGPYFTYNLPVRGSCTGDSVVMARSAGNETQVHEIDVATSSTGVTEVKLIYTLAANPGTATAPGMSKALTWNDTLSGGAGWTAVASNGLQPATGTVTFTRTGGNSTVFIPAGTRVKTAAGIVFSTTSDRLITAGRTTVDASVIAATSGPSGNVAARTVTVIVDPVPGVASVSNAAAMTGGSIPAPGTTRTLTFFAQSGTAINAGGNGARLTIAFEIPTAAAAGDSFPIQVQASNSVSQDYTNFCIRIDNTPPKMTQAWTRDTDYDGRIDMMELVFNKELDSKTLVHSQFDIRERGAVRPYFVLGTSDDLTNAPCNFAPQYSIWLYSCPQRIIVKLAPGPTFDTGALPDVTYPAAGVNGTLTDLAGNLLAPIVAGAVNTTDGAKPVLVSALAKDGSTGIIVTFSEPVRGSGTPVTPGGPKPIRVDPDTCTSNCASDFVYTNSCLPLPPLIQPSPPNVNVNGCARWVSPNGCPPAPSQSQCVGNGDCVGGPDPAGRNMAPQITGVSHSPTGPNANQATIRIGGGTGAAPYRFPRAWGNGQGAGEGSPISPFPPPAGTRGCTNGQLGAGDTGRTTGDLLDLAVEPVPPSNCVNPARKIYDFDQNTFPAGYAPTTGTPPCDKIIQDVHGLRATLYHGGQEPSCNSGCGKVISGPYVNEAEINIDSFKLTLKFNGPVTSASGPNIGIQPQDLSIVTADCAGQGPTGIVAVNHTAGSDEAILTLDHRTRPCDLDDTPSMVRVSGAAGRGVKAFGQDMYVPSYDPDADSLPDVPMVDHTQPAFTPPNSFTPALSTVDADRDGYIDGIKVYFSEPIDDSSFCLGPIANRPPQVCAGDGFFDDAALNHGTECKQPATHSILIVNNIPGPYTWDTDLLPDDNEGIIRFPETPGRLQNTGFTPAISTNPCWTNKPQNGGYVAYGDPSLPGNAGKILCDTDCKRGMGLFADQFHPSAAATPPYMAANYMKRVCGESFGQSGQPLCTASNGITAKVVDGAPPALWSAKTLDTPATGAYCNSSSSAGCEGNGILDGYALTFSEAVNDCSLRFAEWHVAGRIIDPVHPMRTNVPLDQPRAVCPSPKYPPQGQGNANLVLQFREGATADTDAKPELTYSGPSCNSCGMRDLNGNPMAAFGALAINEEDDAPPVIYCVRGFVGRPDITIEFSEGVDNGDRGGIVRDSLLYGNHNQFNSDSASGFSNSIAVQHRAGDRMAYATLNAPLSSKDIKNDTIGAHFHSISEVAPTVAAKKPVSTSPHHYCAGLDSVAPGNVTNLQVITGLTSANAISLGWTAPGSDGQAQGNVTGYRIKVSTVRITPADFNSPASPGTVATLQTSHALDPLSCPAKTNTTTPKCTPTCLNQVQVSSSAVEFGSLVLRTDPDPCQLAQPGQVQRATLVGLQPGTLYHFAVVAFDNATDINGDPKPNYGGMGSDVSTTTGKDNSPPAPAPVIFSAIPPYRSNPERQPTFSWSNATDRESSVRYYVQLTFLDSDRAYTIQCGKDILASGTSYRPSQPLPFGTYTFHVAACSAGGQTATAHYTIIVGAAPLDKGRIRDANEGIQTRPTKLGSQYTINWTLPTEGEIQQYVPGAELEAVQIWRLVCDDPNPCQRQKVKELPGNYTALRTGSWNDTQTNFTSEPYYRVEMVFANGQTQDTSPTAISGFAQPSDITPRASPWIPLLGIILLAAVCAALVAWAILASRKRALSQQIKEEAPAGVDPETGLPTHDVKCPTCSTPFQAVGTLPLQITCPNCGASGILQ